MSAVGNLIALLDGQHITDRALLRARDRALATDNPGAAAALQREIARYFGAVERESAAQVRSIDRRLDDLYQRQYNAQAERGVAERRLLGSRKILAALEASSAEEAG